MAIDPSISLKVRTPEFADPLAAYAKAAQVRNLLTQGQLHQQQIANEQEQLRGAQLKNQETVRAQKDQADFQALLAEKKNYKDAREEAPNRGIRQKFLFTLDDEVNKSAEQTAKTAREKTQAAESAANYMHEKLGPIADVQDPTQQGALFDAAQNDFANVIPGYQKQQYAGPSSVTDHLAQTTLLKHVMQAAEEKRKQAGEQRTADLAGPKLKEAESQAVSAEQKASGTEPMQPKDIATLNREKARDLQISQNEAVMRTQGQQRVNLEGQRLKLEQQRAGFEAGGGVSPAAQMAAEGKMDPQTLRALLRRNPGVLQQIKAVDPNFDEANIDNRYATLKEFGSTSNSKAGGQVLALNTLIHHADLYMEAADALKNGSFTPGNEIYNKISALFGGPAPQNAALVGRFLAGETGKVATGGVPAEGEIKGILSNLSTSASPDQIAGAGKTLLTIAAGRATPLMERAKQAKIDNVIQVLGPDAKDILKRRGFDPETMKPAASGNSGKRGVFNPATGQVEYK